MSNINISLNEVSEIATSIRNYNRRLDDVLSYVIRLIEELNSYWLSEASDTYQVKFREFSRLFSQESEDIEVYASFLDHTVSSYETLESTISANAKEIY